jgi:hypothetical protein
MKRMEVKAQRGTATTTLTPKKHYTQWTRELVALKVSNMVVKRIILNISSTLRCYVLRCYACSLIDRHQSFGGIC